MINVRVVAFVSLGFFLGGQHLAAEAPFQYRAYVLESSVASVLRISGTRDTRTTPLHDRPANIQEVEWRAPYVPAGSDLADPVRNVVFSFYNDQLYQIVATYHRDRVEGLTNDDLIESISATYGVPLLRYASTVRGVLAPDVPLDPAPVDAAIVSQWEDGASLLTLTRSTYPLQYQLVLISKTLDRRARAAIKEAQRLDIHDAPQRELDLRKKDAADARVTAEKARASNKPAFKP